MESTERILPLNLVCDGCRRLITLSAEFLSKIEFAPSWERSLIRLAQYCQNTQTAVLNSDVWDTVLDMVHFEKP